MQVNKEWISISDMMAGLMMVFMFIAIAFMVEINKKQKTIKDIVSTYENTQLELKKDLHKEFDKDLDTWGAEIAEKNIIRFNSPDVLFSKNEHKIPPKFKKILDEFFPRYIKILSQDKYKNNIESINIEGHTSKEENRKDKKKQYLDNMDLSNKRSKKVFTYCYNINDNIINKNRRWLEKKIRVNGMAFAKLIKKPNGKQDKIKSRRVDFKIVTSAENKISRIIDELKD